MRVTFYGVRGSVPSPGPQTARYGGNTSCVEVRLNDGSTLVVDAGTGMRERDPANRCPSYSKDAINRVRLMHDQHGADRSSNSNRIQP